MADLKTEPPRPWLNHYPAGVDWAAEIRAVPVHELVEEAARRFGERSCIDFMGKRYSFAHVAELVAHAAKGLQELGVGPGIKVGLFLPNTPYSVVLFHGVLKAGGTLVNYNPLYAARELIHQIEDSGTDIMATLDLADLMGRIEPLLETTRLRHLIVCPLEDALPFPRNLIYRVTHRKDVVTPPRDERHSRFDDLLANDGRPEAVAIDPARDVALLQYTGGTTGVPKGAMLSHANVSINAAQIAGWDYHAHDGDERVLGVIPLFHVFAMTVVMNYALRIGAEMILLPRFDLDQMIATIRAKRPTILPAVPTIFTALNNAHDVSRSDLSCLRFCISGGAPLPVEVKRRFEELSGCVVVEGYGLSETSPVATVNPVTGLNKAGSIGLPLPQTTIEILSLDGARTPLGPGQRGEIAIRGPQVMLGYWNRPEETAQILTDGLLRTGDVGIMDEDGYVFVVDRVKELVICGGYNVYPRLVEEAIYLHPSVAECAVIGLADTYRGQTVKAFVVVRPGMSLSALELDAFLEDKLSPIERPKLIEFRESLPKSAVGKILKKTLAAEAGASPTG